MTVRRILVLAIGALATAACSETSTSLSTELDQTARFAHESNNQATLSGMQGNNAITGNAIINYIAGTEGWRSSVNLSGALTNGTYTLFAVAPDGVTVMEVCSFTVSGPGGRQGCSADTDLAGFATAQVRDSEGSIVASGTFARRGGNRGK